MRGSIINVAATDAAVGQARNVGGLVGNVARDGILHGEVLSGSVQGTQNIGGLAGTNLGTVMGRSSATDAGKWRTERGKSWPTLIFPSDFPDGQPVEDPKIPDKPANFYE